MNYHFFFQKIICFWIIFISFATSISAQVSANPKKVFGSCHYKTLCSLALSPDGKKFLTGGDDGIGKLWDLKTGEIITTYERHTVNRIGLGGIQAVNINSVAFSPDGKKVLTAGKSKAKLWDTNTGLILGTFEIIGYGHVNVVTFTKDGTKFWTASSNGDLKLWDISTGKLLAKRDDEHTQYIQSIAFSPDEKELIASHYLDHNAKLSSVESGDLIGTFRGHSSDFDIGSVASVAFSPDGNELLTGSDRGELILWNKKRGGKIISVQAHNQSILSLAFSPDGKRVITGSEDNTAKLWDAKTGRLIMTCKSHKGDVCSVVFSHDGNQILTGSKDNTVMLCDISNIK